MVPGNLTPPAGVKRGGRRLSNLQLAGDDGTEMCDHAVGGFLSVLDAQAAALGVDEAGVPDLPARLRIEGVRSRNTSTSSPSMARSAGCPSLRMAMIVVCVVSSL